MSSIQAIAYGQTVILGLWNWPSSQGRFKDLYETLAGGKNALEGYLLSTTRIAQDVERSELGKTKARREKLTEWLGHLARQQRKLNEIAQELDERRRELAAVPPASASDAVVDVAIAARMLAMQSDTGEAGKLRASLISGDDPRATIAALRMPVFLTGLSPKFLSALAVAEVRRRAPAEAAEVEGLGEALGTVQQGLQRAYKEMMRSGLDMPTDEVRATLGDDAWQHLLPADRVARLQQLDELRAMQGDSEDEGEESAQAAA